MIQSMLILDLHRSIVWDTFFFFFLERVLQFLFSKDELN